MKSGPSTALASPTPTCVKSGTSDVGTAGSSGTPVTLNV